MHLNDGTLRAYQDQQLNEKALRAARTHLATCQRCRDRAEILQAGSRRVAAYLANLETDTKLQPIPAKTAHQRLEERLSQIEKENPSMLNRLTSRLSRPVWVGLAVILVLAVALSFPSVRAVATSFLGLFRVEQVRIVQVDLEALPGQLDSSSQLERIFAEQVQVDEMGKPQEVASAAEASALAGIPVRLPSVVEVDGTIFVQQGGSLSFNVDEQLVRRVLQDLGREDIQLPEGIDGAEVNVEIFPSVIALYGECPSPLEETPANDTDPDNPDNASPLNCLSLVQMPSPTISAPPDLAIAKIGEAYLQILGMTQEEAAQFSSTVDWTTTFVFPIPRYRSEYQDVLVDGVRGTLITFNQSGHRQFLLMWVKDGLVYGLNGPGREAEALNIANSLK